MHFYIYKAIFETSVNNEHEISVPYLSLRRFVGCR